MSGMRFGRVVALAAAASLALAGCAGGTSSSSSGGDGSTIKIGFMGDLTGENSGIVIPGRNGARLAVDEYNATNPAKKITLEEYDTQGDASQATPILTKAVTDDTFKQDAGIASAR